MGEGDVALPLGEAALDDDRGAAGVGAGDRVDAVGEVVEADLGLQPGSVEGAPGVPARPLDSIVPPHGLGMMPAPCVTGDGYRMRRSIVTSTPDVPPGPMRPFTSTEVIAFSCQPCWA